MVLSISMNNNDVFTESISQLDLSLLSEQGKKFVYKQRNSDP